jgi:aspartyl-tRNA(Asn)/glutamyl-tRNA(Gln) amidotransferase subunit A
MSFREQSTIEAQVAENNLKKNQARPLEGIPIAIKDNLDLTGEITTAGSKILSNYRAVFTATAVQRLRDAGAIIIGKTNLDEFAMGGSTENSAFHPTHNPWDIDCVPGGSSGGSAVTVAAGHVPVALGSDTGGSVRQPAAFCGVVGVKPTYGRVSRSGLIALASSLDVIGPLTRTVADAARVYEIIAGPDRDDATTVDRPVEPIQPLLTGDIKGLRIGLPKEFFGDGVDKKIAQTIKVAADALSKLGAEISDVTVPRAPLGLPTYYVILPAEASANLARYDGIRYGQSADDVQNLIDLYAASRDRGFGPEVKRRIMIGTYVLSAGYADRYYRQAVRVRNLLLEDFHQVFDTVDVLLTPTSPIQPFKLGSRIDDPLQMYMTDLLTVPANLAGLPAMSIPAGLVDGLPVGLQLMADRWNEAAMFRVAYAFEQATDWHNQHPPR